VLVCRQRIGIEGGAGDAEHAQAVVRHAQNLIGDCRSARDVEVAQINDCLRRAFGRDHALALIWRLPDSRHGQHLA
jgi:hypothetical protein